MNETSEIDRKKLIKNEFYQFLINQKILKFY